MLIDTGTVFPYWYFFWSHSQKIKMSHEKLRYFIVTFWRMFFSTNVLVIGDLSHIGNLCSDALGEVWWYKPHLTFIEFLSSFFGSRAILAGRHVALQRAVPCKAFMTVRTLKGLLTYSKTTQQKKTRYSQQGSTAPLHDPPTTVSPKRKCSISADISHTLCYLSVFPPISPKFSV